MRTLTVCAALVAALSLTGLGGCGGTAPTLTVTDAYVAEPGAEATLVHVVIDATNPTPQPLALWAMAYDASTGAGAAQRWAQASVPPNGSVRFEVPVVVAGAAGQTVSISGKVDYVPAGRIRELLSELDVPLPSTGFGGSVAVASQRPASPPGARTGQVFTARLVEPRPLNAVDTLPPLPGNKN